MTDNATALAVSSAASIADQLPDQPTFGQVLRVLGFDSLECDRFEHIVLPFRPFPHQLKGLLKGLQEVRFGLSFEPRTGKTLVMQMLAIFMLITAAGPWSSCRRPSFASTQRIFRKFKDMG